MADFEYHATIGKNNNGELEIYSYNSPYSERQDSQSIDDIKFAIETHKILDITSLKPNKKYKLKMLCRFKENKDNTFDQMFILKELKNE